MPDNPTTPKLTWLKDASGNLRLVDAVTHKARGIVWTGRCEGEFKFRVGDYFSGRATVHEAQAAALSRAVQS